MLAASTLTLLAAALLSYDTIGGCVGPAVHLLFPLSHGQARLRIDTVPIRESTSRQNCIGKFANKESIEFKVYGNQK